MRDARKSFPLLPLLLLAAAACGESREPPVATTRAFDDQFRFEVYPVLLRDCGFPACHGDPKRFFRVWGPGRVRLPNDTTMRLPDALSLPSGPELTTTMALALSMIDERDLARSPLLRKPLAVSGGGSGHMGVDNFGRDVYRSTSDSGFQVLLRWVFARPPAPAPPATP